VCVCACVRARARMKAEDQMFYSVV